jgi:hypothetical protein
LQRCRESDRSGGTDFRGYFQASELDVNGDGRRDLIVQPTSCLIGAHSTTLWIFTNSNQRLLPGFERVFMKQADYLKVLRTSTNGYRDMESGYATALELYGTIWKFDGTRYQPSSCWIEDRARRVTRIRCDQ